jgi:hypothetical protein
MSRLAEYLEKVDSRDDRFVGTVAFRNEEIILPDGSKMALGIDDGHWVLVYQEKAGSAFQVFECDWHNRKIWLDKKAGAEKEFNFFKSRLKYFFSSSQLNDLVTLLPPSA